MAIATEPTVDFLRGSIIIMQDYPDHKLAPNQYQNWAFRLNGPSYHYYGPFILCKEMKGFSYLKNVPSCGHDNCDVWFQTYCAAQVSTKDINSRPFALLSFIFRFRPHFIQLPYLFCKSIIMGHGSFKFMRGPYFSSLCLSYSFNFWEPTKGLTTF